MPGSHRVNPESSGFRYAADPQAARRQLVVSVTLVVVLAVAIVAAALCLNARPVAVRAFAIAVPIVIQHQAADRSLAVDAGG